MENTGSLFLSLNFENGAVPASIEIIPAGAVIRGRDGRKWKKDDPRKVVLNSMARQSKLVIDENHATDLSAPKGGPSPAMGWMTGLRAGEGGSIWADVEWTKRGEQAVLNREYSHISPVFLYNEEGTIKTVLRAALTNTPNLELPALNSEQPENAHEEMPMDHKALCAALGLPETATEADVSAFIKAFNAARPGTAQARAEPLKADLAAYAPRADLNAMEARALAAEQQIAELNAARLQKDAEAAVDGAIKNRKIAPASRAEYLALCSTKEGFEKIKNIFSKNPAVISAETQAPEGAPGAAGTVALNAEETAAFRALGYSEEEIAKIKEGKK